MLPAAIGGAALLALATAVRVYRGGTTLNDHFVAALATGCVAVYPVLWGGALVAGVAGPLRTLLGIALALGASSIYGLFHVLDGRRDPGLLLWWARLSQLAYSFSLWTGLWLILRAPVVLFTGGGLAALCWPGWSLLLPTGLAVWGTAWTYLAGERIREHAVPAPGLRRPVRLLHLSDLHVGPTMTKADMARLMRQSEALKPDLIVVTGDLVMPYSEEEHGFLIQALAGASAPVFACLGNHDLPVKERLKAELEAVGVRMLVDEAALIQVGEATLELVGVDFHWRSARDRLLDALSALPPAPEAHARVLLAHDPRLFRWVPEDRFHLVLSGHTHGGQLGWDMFGLQGSVLRWAGVLDQGFWRRGAQLLYVHRGNWSTGLPPRMGIASELVLHHLGGGEAPEARAVPERRAI